LSTVGRAGTPDEIGAVGSLLIGPNGAFITGSDLLMDAGVATATGIVNSLQSDAKGSVNSGLLPAVRAQLGYWINIQLHNARLGCRTG
jgi:hypothetical protein